MTGQGDYLIVGKPFDRDWIVWGGGLDKWGPFGEERRFSTTQEAASYLEDARRDAVRQCLKVNNAIYIARVVQPKVTWQGLVYHDGNEVAVDFSDDDLSPRQMRELGVL